MDKAYPTPSQQKEGPNAIIRQLYKDKCRVIIYESILQSSQVFLQYMDMCLELYFNLFSHNLVLSVQEMRKLFSGIQIIQKDQKAIVDALNVAKSDDYIVPSCVEAITIITQSLEDFKTYIESLSELELYYDSLFDTERDRFASSIRAIQSEPNTLPLKVIFKEPTIYIMNLFEQIMELSSLEIIDYELNNIMNLLNQLKKINVILQKQKHLPSIIKTGTDSDIMSKTKDNSMNPNRFLIRHDIMFKIGRYKIQKYRVFLYSDIIEYIPFKGNDITQREIRYSHVEPTHSILPFYPTPYAFIVYSQKKSILLCCDSEDIRNTWVTKIQDNIALLYYFKSPFIAPPLVMNNTIQECDICQAPFSIFNIKHFCEACGMIVCRKCLTAKVYTPFTNQQQNVCFNCEQILKPNQQLVLMYHQSQKDEAVTDANLDITPLAIFTKVRPFSTIHTHIYKLLPESSVKSSSSG
ncbi:hypothetical protein WA158_004587 [Blastocystis sp. Blastoise]